MRIFVVLALTAAAVMVTIGKHRHAPTPTRVFVFDGKAVFCEGMDSLFEGEPTGWRCRPIDSKDPGAGGR